jgi:hypothetical protein
LIELERRGERFAEFLEDRDFARFALLVRNARIAAAFDGGKLFHVLHVRLDLSLEWHSSLVGMVFSRGDAIGRSTPIVASIALGSRRSKKVVVQA